MCVCVWFGVVLLFCKLVSLALCYSVGWFHLHCVILLAGFTCIGGMIIHHWFSFAESSFYRVVAVVVQASADVVLLVVVMVAPLPNSRWQPGWTLNLSLLGVTWFRFWKV